MVDKRGRAAVVVPERVDLVAFFDGQPVEESQGLTIFQHADQRGVTLRFSYDVFERSVQTLIEVLGQPVVVVSHEELATVCLRDGCLVALCESPGSRTELTVDLRVSVSVVWSSLVI